MNINWGNTAAPTRAATAGAWPGMVALRALWLRSAKKAWTRSCSSSVFTCLPVAALANVPLLLSCLGFTPCAPLVASGWEAPKEEPGALPGGYILRLFKGSGAGVAWDRKWPSGSQRGAIWHRAVVCKQAKYSKSRDFWACRWGRRWDKNQWVLYLLSTQVRKEMGREKWKQEVKI